MYGSDCVILAASSSVLTSAVYNNKKINAIYSMPAKYLKYFHKFCIPVCSPGKQQSRVVPRKHHQRDLKEFMVDLQ